MKDIGGYAVEVVTQRPFDEAVARATQLLAEQGFGVLTEIDVGAVLKQKLGVEVKPYRILGACNPAFARRALAAVPHVGVFLPCNVVIWDEGTHRIVAAIEPLMMAEAIAHPELVPLTDELSARLHAVLEQMG